MGLGLGVDTPSSVPELDSRAEVTSPLELTEFVSDLLHDEAPLQLLTILYDVLQVDNLLNDLESRFDAMSTDVLSRRTFAPLAPLLLMHR